MVDRSGTRIALISMPWQDPFSPSIQLGTLAAYMGEERPGVRVDTFDLFLELADAVGIYLSKRIAINWLGEALFAYLLFPGQAASIASYLEHSRKDDPAFAAIDYAELIEGLRTTLLARLDAVDWTQYAMIGLSVVFSQTFSSLLAAREIKRRAPDVPIVLGGPGVTGKIGKSLLDAFGFVDYIVNGEGELPLAALVDALEAQPRGTPVDVRGVFHRGSSEVSTAAVHQVADMTVLPVPDYSGYFRTLAATRDPAHVKGRVRSPTRPAGAAGGTAAWSTRCRAARSATSNLQWGAYREKSVERSVLDLQELVERYDCPDFTVVDNILRYKDVDVFIDRIGELDMGLDLWMEARVSVKPEQMRRLREVGARVIQFGIESLSTSMLKKMVKGTTAIANLQAMKFCEQYGIQNSANLIIEFPGMTEADIAETLDNIASARAYFPLSTTEFSLVYQSPAFKMPQGFGITNVRNYHMYKLLLPADLYERLFLTEKAFDSEEARPAQADVAHGMPPRSTTGASTTGACSPRSKAGCCSRCRTRARTSRFATSAAAGRSSTGCTVWSATCTWSASAPSRAPTSARAFRGSSPSGSTPGSTAGARSACSSPRARKCSRWRFRGGRCRRSARRRRCASRCPGRCPSPLARVEGALR